MDYGSTRTVVDPSINHPIIPALTHNSRENRKFTAGSHRGRGLLQSFFRLERRPVTFEGEKLGDTAHRK